MNKLLKSYLRNVIAKSGLAIEFHTPKELVVSLIQKLHPFLIDKDLIRLGPIGDGGYLLPDDLDNIEACFSPGVDVVSGFEEDCLEHGMKIFLADKSVDKPNFNLSSDKYNFLKKYVGCTNNSDFITMDEWVNSSHLDKNSDLLLQMDIEGDEYFSLLNISNFLLERFRILVIEFHFLDKLWNPYFYNLAEVVFNKILQTHICVHIHPNNILCIDTQLGVEIPKIAEFTFIRKDRINYKKGLMQFPNMLDCDNTKNKHIKLPNNWYLKS